MHAVLYHDDIDVAARQPGTNMPHKHLLARSGEGDSSTSLVQHKPLLPHAQPRNLWQRELLVYRSYVPRTPYHSFP